MLQRILQADGLGVVTLRGLLSKGAEVDRQTIGHGLEQQLRDRRPAILKATVVVLAALARLLGTATPWQLVCVKLLPL
jgi:hypothetical protein